MKLLSMREIKERKNSPIWFIMFQEPRDPPTRWMNLALKLRILIVEKLKTGIE